MLLQVETICEGQFHPKTSLMCAGICRTLLMNHKLCCWDEYGCESYRDCTSSFRFLHQVNANASLCEEMTKLELELEILILPGVWGIWRFGREKRWGLQIFALRWISRRRCQQGRSLEDLVAHSIFGHICPTHFAIL